MLTSNGYCLTYYKTKNQITIRLPQTCETTTNTYEKVIDRRTDVEEKDLAILLNIVELIFHKGVKMDEVTE